MGSKRHHITSSVRDDRRLAQAIRLNWIEFRHLFDPDMHIAPTSMEDCWRMMTPGVQQMVLDKLDFIDGDDSALGRHPDRNSTQADWDRHAQYHADR